MENTIFTFSDAITFVKQLPYKRNPNKNDLTTLFSDNCGTCSTKHALLKQLIDENQANTDFSEIKLMLGIFKMNAKNTPQIAEILSKNNLDYIPEAHNYLKFKDKNFDFTKSSSKPTNFEFDLLEELEISPHQITEFKVNYHKNYLTNWLQNIENKYLNIDFNALWIIREQCIQVF